MLVKDMSSRPRAQLEQLGKLARTYYGLLDLVDSFHASQRQIRLSLHQLKQLPDSPDLPHAEPVLHEVQDLALTYEKLACEYFEKFQAAAFAVLEEDLGLKNVRGEYITVVSVREGKRKKERPFRYARIDIDPQQFEPTHRFVFHIGEDAQFNACPNDPLKPGKDHRAHRYTNNPFFGETWEASFV